MSSINKKEDIINASIELFMDQGYDRPSMDTIAKTSNVSKRTLYKHFSNKRALLDEILIYLINKNNSQSFIDYESIPSFEEQVFTFIKNKTLQFTQSDSVKLAKIILSENLKESGFTKEKLDNIHRAESASMKWIQHAISKGHLPKTVEPLEQLTYLNKLIKGFFFFPTIFEEDFITTDEEIKFCTETFLNWVDKQSS